MITQAIKSWVTQALQESEVRIEPVAGDASFRQYHRIYGRGGTYILMVSPPDKEDPQAFIALARAWYRQGIHVPEIHHVQVEQGWLLISDLGATLYSAILTMERAPSLYADALAALHSLRVAQQGYGYPIFDQAFMRREMGYVLEWLLPHHLQITLPEAEQQALEADMAVLAARIDAQPKGVIHRDYHSRNLLFSEKNNPGIIDFQDAMIGPALYDPVSLLKDAYIDWPEEKIWAWLAPFWAETGLPGSWRQAQAWFDEVSLQRHLKVLGIFARLAYRDHKKDYLQYMPRVAGYVRQALVRYPEGAAMRHVFHTYVEPALCGP